MWLRRTGGCTCAFGGSPFPIAQFVRMRAVTKWQLFRGGVYIYEAQRASSGGPTPLNPRIPFVHRKYMNGRLRRAAACGGLRRRPAAFHRDQRSARRRSTRHAAARHATARHAAVRHAAVRHAACLRRPAAALRSAPPPARVDGFIAISAQPAAAQRSARRRGGRLTLRATARFATLPACGGLRPLTLRAASRPRRRFHRDQRSAHRRGGRLALRAAARPRRRFHRDQRSARRRAPKRTAHFT